MASYGSYEWWTEVIDLDRLKDLVDRFAAAMHVGAVIATTDGTALTIPSNFCAFCRRLRSHPEGRCGCERSDAWGGEHALDVGGPLVYRCHCGLIDMASPLIIEGRLVGTLLCGQVLLRPYTEEEVRKEIVPLWPCDATEIDDWVQDFLALPVVDETTVLNAMNLLNVMASHVVELCERHLIESKLLHRTMELVKAQRDKETLERNLKMAQLKALQNQLNPHFMFNTLNIMSRMAMFEGAPQTQELTIQFADYLRYILRRQSRDELVPLSSELECLKQYLSIQKVRFSDRFSYVLDVEPEALSCKIPFLILQPIVENAVVHGIEPSLRPGVVLLRGKICEGRLEISVEDNGVGCLPEKIKEGLGISHVKERLKLHYGNDASFRIWSKPDVGTKVGICISCKED
ncbi:MAG TPA: PocR ligand-binding domain-containing protein [Acetomicrobium flavidum]|uniref:sensor histidine kinase n=1 Tax=Acetomicrobium flavidum TaxID=49896 RepID=UPI002C0AE304|nr:PocR ligand-binding domain-containing protein [Acetomicrobium flavidum]HOM31412.1 PocR ligand-binding domain-containing protein [Acetomicrobium flavidum]